MGKEQPVEKKIPNLAKFILGGGAGMAATCVVQPLDLLKTRMQIGEYKTSAQALTGVISKEGPLALYKGLSAGLLRQATYTTTRLGVYTYLIEKFASQGQNQSFAIKAAFGMIAGIAGSFIGTPAEVALIRMTSDGKLPPAERRNYTNVFNALIRMTREEGILTLWRGAIPTMSRAMVVNAAQLASYSQAKELLMSTGFFKENIMLHFCGSMISGLLTTITSMPVDIVKTRIQNMKTVNGKPEFSGGLDVIGKLMKNEGVFALWKGFLPYYARLGPHTVLTFICLEEFNRLYKKFML